MPPAPRPSPGSRPGPGPSSGSHHGGNTIGGTTPAARNLISGNSAPARTALRRNDRRHRAYVQGNLIGTDVTGTRALGNGSGWRRGRDRRSQPGRRFVVGGPEAGAGNVISGNGGIGVRSANGVVQGNFIGTDVTGTLAIGNSIGVQISGDVTLASNTIAFNSSTGVSATRRRSSSPAPATSSPKTRSSRTAASSLT